jgi:alkylhydroperoxidase family enzyme
LQLQGGDPEIAEALGKGNLAAAPVTEAERVLLAWVELLTRHAYKNTPDDVARVRAAGWTDEQISEAAYVAAIFAFFNRVADAFGLVDPGYDQLQPPAGKMP